VVTLAILTGYAVALAFVLRLLAAAKRDEESMLASRAVGPDQWMPYDLPVAVSPSPVEMLPAHVPLGRLAVELRDSFDVEQVSVVVSDPEDPGIGVVGACLGAPGLLGSRIPVVTEPTTGLLNAAEAAALGLGEDGEDDAPWTYAHVPIPGADGLLGAVTVATRRSREFRERDLVALERVARQRTPQFDRRRHSLLPRAIA
jgi:hypothetical protein